MKPIIVAVEGKFIYFEHGAEFYYDKKIGSMPDQEEIERAEDALDFLRMGSWFEDLRDC